MLTLTVQPGEHYRLQDYTLRHLLGWEGGLRVSIQDKHGEHYELGIGDVWKGLTLTKVDVRGATFTDSDGQEYHLDVDYGFGTTGGDREAGGEDFDEAGRDTDDYNDFPDDYVDTGVSEEDTKENLPWDRYVEGSGTFEPVTLDVLWGMSPEHDELYQRDLKAFEADFFAAQDAEQQGDVP